MARLKPLSHGILTTLSATGGSAPRIRIAVWKTGHQLAGVLERYQRRLR